MSDVINSIFGRPKNENTGGYAYGTVEPEPVVVAEAPAVETDADDTVDAEAVVEDAAGEEPESAPEAEATTETAEDETEDDAAETDDSEEDEAEEADEDVAGTEESDEAAADDDTELDTAETEAEAEPVAEADEPAEDEAVVAEAEPVAETEPVAEAAPVAEAEPAAAARPAAGTRGSTTVADGVVGKIVLRIAAQTEGVHSVDESGITVELADDVAWITIPVVVEFGHAVKALGEQVRVAVIDAVEQYLGLDVEVVDVHVTDIHFPELG